VCESVHVPSDVLRFHFENGNYAGRAAAGASDATTQPSFN
jgi:hypothetical protein